MWLHWLEKILVQFKDLWLNNTVQTDLNQKIIPI